MRTVMFVSNPFTNDARVYNESASLIRAGHEVTVIAWDRGGDNPPRQTVDGIEVVRLRTGLRLHYGFASWLWNGFNLLLWWRQAYHRTLALNKERRFDVVHCHDLDTLAIGTRLKRNLGIPLVYDAHEIYGYMMARTFGTRLARLFLWLERRLVARADAMITEGEGRRRYFAGITGKSIYIVMNCKPLQSLEYQPPADDFALLYVGSLHQGRAIPMLVQVAGELTGVRCLIGGIGRPDYVEALEADCARTSNVTFLGRVPLDQVIPMTKKAHVVVCPINAADSNNRLGMANKIGEAMVCGRPTVCTKGTYSGEIVEGEHAGLVVENSVEALREAIIRLRDDAALRERLGRNALKAAIREYNWEKQEEELLKLYGSLRVNGE